MLKVVALGALLGFSLCCQSHTVKLGTEVVRGACAVLQESNESRFLIYKQQSSRVHYGDGVVEITAVIIPSKQLSDNSPDDDMTICAKEVAAQPKDRKSLPQPPDPEDGFRLQLNQCLRSRKAPSEAAVVILRRSEVICPSKPNQ